MGIIKRSLMPKVGADDDGQLKSYSPLLCCTLKKQ